MEEHKNMVYKENNSSNNEELKNVIHKENKDINYDFINKMYRYMKNGMSIETFKDKFNLSDTDLAAILELCEIYGKQIEVVEDKDTLVFKKNRVKRESVEKLAPDDNSLIYNQILVVSDTHFGSIHHQLHMLNEAYEEAYKRGITTALHVGDVLDGNYPSRPENPRQQCLHGFDEQAGFVADMYPVVDGMKTYYILGSHDETHYKNGQATLNHLLDRCRSDMEYLGQDQGSIDIDGVKVVMDHPGGGSAQTVSYKLQKRIEIMESRHKPKILLVGHYHKSYYMFNRNVHALCVPALCDKTQFQTKQGLLNCLGYYFLHIYSDAKGNIQYFDPEEIRFGTNDIWDEPGKDKSKVKQLVIKEGKY